MSSVLDVERSLAPRMGTRAPGLLSADDIGRQVSRALALNRRFAEDPRWPLSQHIPHEGALEHLVEGLKKAGLQPSPAKP